MVPSDAQFPKECWAVISRMSSMVLAIFPFKGDAERYQEKLLLDPSGIKYFVERLELRDG